RRIGQEQRNVRKGHALPAHEGDERGLEDVVRAHPPGPLVNALEDRERVLDDEVWIVRGKNLEWIEPYGPSRVLGSDEDHVVRPLGRDPLQEGTDKVPLRIEHRHTTTSRYVLGREIQQDRRLPRTRGSEKMEVVPGVGNREADLALGVAPRGSADHPAFLERRDGRRELRREDALDARERLAWEMPQRRELRGGQDKGVSERKTLATAYAVAADSSRFRKDESIRTREHSERRHRRLEGIRRLRGC